MTTIYVQLWENRLRVIDPVSKQFFDEPPLVAIKENGASRLISAVGKSASLDSSDVRIVNPFAHPRLLVSDFELAEAVLRYALRKVGKKGIFSSPPRVVFQPMEKTQGGISEIEKRVYSELCLSCGAREVVIFDSEERNPELIEYSEILLQQNQSTLRIAKRKTSYLNHVFLVAIVILIFYLKKAAN